MSLKSSDRTFPFCLDQGKDMADGEGKESKTEAALVDVVIPMDH